jgi:hypothetical protein
VNASHHPVLVRLIQEKLLVDSRLREIMWRKKGNLELSVDTRPFPVEQKEYLEMTVILSFRKNLYFVKNIIQ